MIDLPFNVAQTLPQHPGTTVQIKMLLGISSFYLLPMLATATASAKYFTNGWSVQISSNGEAEAERVAREIKSIMKGKFKSQV